MQRTFAVNTDFTHPEDNFKSVLHAVFDDALKRFIWHFFQEQNIKAVSPATQAAMPPPYRDVIYVRFSPHSRKCSQQDTEKSSRKQQSTPDWNICEKG